MTVALRYETFIRRAFGAQDGEMLERWGDPAKMANTDYFSDHHFNEVKATTGYAMLTFNAYIQQNTDVNPQDSQRMNSIVSDVINASDLTAIATLIDEYVNNIERVYIPLPTN
ncbi:hypothetical protein CN952_06015 [Bacillus cereus]|uniref:hypothetical protein n=1 Tax=Bacillus TaxID=1386 RepID=UPI000BFB3E18|nr:hypothetical protein [Bacillus cereus]MDA2236367.1 hypothetical protein [Bacillus cereus]MEB9437348.1 hypothetical protein [Bacillus cereus]PGM75391.1 hypothetical protein CN952_06015 [Bacillus cereus]PGN13088.1 hypothetical protein CN954_12535 [Bacillus cereus]